MRADESRLHGFPHVTLERSVAGAIVDCIVEWLRFLVSLPFTVALALLGASAEDYVHP